MSLIIELTPSEQWSAEQVAGALKGSMDTHRAATKALEEAQQGLQVAETYRQSFVAAVLKSHQKQDPGTPPAFGPSKLGMRLTWPDPPPAPKPTVVTPAPPKAGKVTKLPVDASPAKKAAAGRKLATPAKKKKAKKKRGKRG